MKKLLLIIILSIAALSCKKEEVDKAEIERKQRIDRVMQSYIGTWVAHDSVGSWSGLDSTYAFSWGNDTMVVTSTTIRGRNYTLLDEHKYIYYGLNTDTLGLVYAGDTIGEYVGVRYNYQGKLILPYKRLK